MTCYCVEIAQEMPKQRTDHNVPLWEALVAVADEVEKSVEGSRQWHAMEIARTAIGRLKLVNDPDFKPQARRAWQVHFDGTRYRYPEKDFTFPHFVTDNGCKVWFLNKPKAGSPFSHV